MQVNATSILESKLSEINALILFYEEWPKGMNYHKAFRKVQMQMKRRYSNPYYWAGFVLMG